MEREIEVVELHKKSIQGDRHATTALIKWLQQRVKRNSYINGKLNEDRFQEFNITLVRCTNKIRFNNVEIEELTEYE